MNIIDELVNRGLVNTRVRARKLLRDGKILLDGKLTREPNAPTARGFHHLAVVTKQQYFHVAGDGEKHTS